MSSYPAPTAILPFFNPAVFTVDETALTIGDANKLYFKKSGGIINGPVSMPSLTLNGVSVSNKLNEIDANSNKLTDISYNNNTTSILNDLSVNGVLKLPNLTNAGITILDNKQKTTKISYDAGTSVTTIADTLKSSGTLIVGSQNYNASDEFYKLIGITRGASPVLTITDGINMIGTLNLPNHSNIDTILTNFETILLNMSYTAGTDLLTISSNVKIPQNLQLGTIADVEQTILDINNTTTNLETKVTGISYNTGTSVTTIADTLKSSGTLIVGSQNYNASDEFYKLSGVSRDASFPYLTITDVVNFNGILNLQTHSDLDTIITQFDTILLNMSYTSTGSLLTISSNVKIPQNLELGTITDVEQKIIDISNNASGGVPSITYDAVTETTSIDGNFVIIPQLTIRPEVDLQDAVQEIYSKNGTATLKLGDDNGVTTTFTNILKSENGNATFYGNNSGETKFMEYNSTDDKINISKYMDLSLNDLNCKFMRRYSNGSKYWLSQNHNSSVFEFRNGGHHIDSFNPGSASTGRDMYINYYAQAGVILGSNLVNSTSKVNGNLIIDELTGKSPASSGGSLTLIHQDTGGSSSIVFKSKRDLTDYAYISYTDDIDAAGGEKSLLEIGSQNDSGDSPSVIDNIAIMPSGFLGINRRDPEYMLDLSGDMRTYNTIIGERPYLNTDGNGISVKPLTNPSLNGGSIFDVRSIGNGCRLYCGQSVTSSVKNPFYFGYNSTDGQEGLSTNYTGKLGTDGSVECSEVKVNSIPLNSFTNIFLGSEYLPKDNSNSTIKYGDGLRLKYDSVNTTNSVSYSHLEEFILNSTSGDYFTCKNSNFFGTYEITATVIFRNYSGSQRYNPVIGIAIDNDTNDVTDATLPNWGKKAHGLTPFSVQYVRMNEGKSCDLKATRIHHFTDTTEEISINTYLKSGSGDEFNNFSTQYQIGSACISFKYLGNFENIT